MFTATATDSDLPANTLTYSLSGAVPAGAVIDSVTGVFTWTPSQGEAAVYSFDVVVSDGTLTDYETITVTVLPLIVFSDGFESGSFPGQWTGTTITSGETATVIGGAVHHGSYGARFTADSTSGSEDAYAYRSVENLDEVYVRGYFNLQSGLPMTGNNDDFGLLSLLNGGTAIASFGVNRHSGVNVWYLINPHC